MQFSVFFMNKESRLAYLVRKDPELAAGELHQDVAEDYSYILNQINKFEKIMKNNSIPFNDSGYLDIRNSLIKSFKKFCLYFESSCSRIGEDFVDHYKPKMVSLSGSVSAFDARKELSREYWKIVKDVKNFDFYAEKIGVEIFSQDYIGKKRNVEKFFDKYYGIVDGRLREKDFVDF